MVFKHNQPSNQPGAESHEPVRIGEVVYETVDLSGHNISVDPQREAERKLKVAEHTAEILEQVRSDAIAELELPDDERLFTRQDIQDIQNEHLTAIADREELRQQIKQEEQPPNNPRP